MPKVRKKVRGAKQKVHTRLVAKKPRSAPSRAPSPKPRAAQRQSGRAPIAKRKAAPLPKPVASFFKLGSGNDAELAKRVKRSPATVSAWKRAKSWTAEQLNEMAKAVSRSQGAKRAAKTRAKNSEANLIVLHEELFPKLSKFHRLRTVAAPGSAERIKKAHSEFYAEKEKFREYVGEREFERMMEEAADLYGDDYGYDFASYIDT